MTRGSCPGTMWLSSGASASSLSKPSSVRRALRGGKGDVYSGDDFRRFVRWTAKVDEDARHGRQGSVRHWAHYSPLKDRLTSNIDALVAQLRSAMSRTSDDLDFSYQSLDVVSEYVEVIGVERARQELYDHLVAYVGEVLKARIHGRWQLRRDHPQPHPYLVGAKHDRTMPINVVWQELSGLAPVNLGTVAANEARRTRKLPGFIADVATSVQAAAPEGVLATLQADATRSRNDRRMAGCGSSPSTPRRNNSAIFINASPFLAGILSKSAPRKRPQRGGGERWGHRVWLCSTTARGARR